MKTVVHLSASSSRLPDHVFHHLLNIYPAGAMKVRGDHWDEILVTSWNLKLPINGRAAQLAINYLIAEGYLVGNMLNWSVAKDGINISLTRKYSQNDREQSELLHFGGLRYVDDLGWRTSDGMIVLSVGRLRPLVSTNADTLFTDRPGWMAVSNRVRTCIERENLRHVVFRPTILVRGKGLPYHENVPWQQFGDPWWEITSDLTLPALSPTVQIVAQDRTRFVSYDTQNLEIIEGLYRVPELHYRRSDLKQVDDFDVALSCEHIGKPPYQQMRIASQRLYKIFVKHGLKASWVPVRIDDSNV